MNPDNEQLAHLISGVSDSLHREMHEGFARVTERFDMMATRLDRHGALLQTGSRWSARMTDWSEQIDRQQEDRDKKLADLEKRVSDPERKRNGHQ